MRDYRDQTGFFAAALVLAIFSPAPGHAGDTQPLVATRTDSVLGSLLTDGAGKTLYISTGDRDCESHCNGACARQWQPLPADRTTLPGGKALPGIFSAAVRDDGSSQLCYNGQPLYTSHLDESPGDQRGNGTESSWYAANIQPIVRLRPAAGEKTVLIGPTGMSLYVLSAERQQRKGCRDGCAENWPPLLTSQRVTAPTGLHGKLGTRRRPPPDRRLQVTYQGKPLHYWSRDRVPGDTGGDGIGGMWQLAVPVQENR